MIELIDFSKSYVSLKKNDFSVKNVNMKITDGKIVGLLGVNGSGKSTIIKTICEQQFLTFGKINVIGEIGYVPEVQFLPPNLKVSEFLHWVCNFHNIFKEDEKFLTENVVKKCHLGDFLGKKIKTLSKGQKQRVSFAQCLIFNPKNIVLDEPFSGLDPAQIIQTRSLISELSKDKAILLSSHILSEIHSLCDEIYILNKGKIVCNGTEKQIIEKTNCIDFEQAFLKLSVEME